MLRFKYLTVLLALIFMVSMAGAYDILVWDKDEGDVYEGVGTEVGVIDALDGLGHTTTKHTGESLPADISSYDMVFALTGWYSC
jgi:hypothetical protein